MPFGAYKINAWGGNLNDGPIIPNGLTNVSGSLALSPLVIPNPSTQNYNDQIKFFGKSNIYYYWVLGYGSSAASYTACICYNLNTGVVTNSEISSNVSRGNNEVNAAEASNCGGQGMWGAVQSIWNQGLSANAIRANFTSVSNFTTAGSSAPNFSGGNTTADILQASNFDKGKSVTSSYVPGTNAFSSNSSSMFFAMGNNSGTNWLQFSTYTTSGTFTSRLNTNNTTQYYTTNGLRLCRFVTGSSISNYQFGYLGYHNSPQELYIGSILFNNTTLTFTQGASSLSIPYTSKNAMIKTIWENDVPVTDMAAVMYDNQYLKFVKFNGYGSSHSVTVSQPFLISSNANPWYRLSGTGINGLGALIYYEVDNNFYIKFFSINTTMDAIQWGEPILLQNNTVSNMTIMNAEVRYINTSFNVGIFASSSDGVSSAGNTVFTNILYPSIQRNNNSLLNSTSFFYNNAQSTYPALNSLQKKFGNTSLLCNGGMMRTLTQNCFSSIGTGPWTIEFWGYFTGNSAQSAAVFTVGNTSSSDYNFRVGYINSYRIAFFYSYLVGPSAGINNNQWQHIAIVSTTGSDITIYVNGLIGATATMGGPLNWASFTGSTKFTFADNAASNNPMLGYIDEFRLSKVARYPTSFTPPTAPFTNDVNTLCLMHFNGASTSTKIYDDYGPGYIG